MKRWLCICGIAVLIGALVYSIVCNIGNQLRLADTEDELFKSKLALSQCVGHKIGLSDEISQKNWMLMNIFGRLLPPSPAKDRLPMEINHD